MYLQKKVDAVFTLSIYKYLFGIASAYIEFEFRVQRRGGWGCITNRRLKPASHLYLNVNSGTVVFDGNMHVEYGTAATVHPETLWPQLQNLRYLYPDMTILLNTCESSPLTVLQASSFYPNNINDSNSKQKKVVKLPSSNAASITIHTSVSDDETLSEAIAAQNSTQSGARSPYALVHPRSSTRQSFDPGQHQRERQQVAPCNMSSMQHVSARCRCR